MKIFIRLTSSFTQNPNQNQATHFPLILKIPQTLLYAIILLLTGYTNAQQAQLINEAGDFDTNAMTSDAQGNLYFTGQVYDTALIGTTIVPAYGYSNAVVYKMDTLGNIIWLRNLQDPMPGIPNIYQYSSGIIISNQQELWILGYYTDTMSINGTMYTSFPVQQSKSFLVKMNPTTGAILSVDIGLTSGSMRAYCLYRDATGNIYIGGNINGVVNFNNFTIGTAGTMGGIIVKLDPNGNLIWQTPIVGQVIGTLSPGNIHVDAQNNVIFNMDTQNVPGMTIGGTPLTLPILNQLNHSAAIIKLDPNGNFSWMKYMDGYGTLNAGVSDLAGNIYFCGHVDSLVYFMNNQYTTQLYSNDAIVGKLDPSGNLIWLKQFGETGHEAFNTISIDQNDNLILGGYMSKPLTINNQFLPNSDFYQKSLFMSIHINGMINWVLNDNSNNLETNANLVHVTPGNNLIFKLYSKRYFLNTGVPQINFLGSNTTLNNQKFQNNTYYIRHTFNRISGKVFLDSNINGQLDPGETGINGVHIGLSNGYSFATTDIQGNYLLFADTGNNVITINNPNANYTVTTNPLPGANFPGGSMIDTANHVGLHCPTNVFDLSVEVIPLTFQRFARPFFYQIQNQNKGSMAQTVNLSFILPLDVNLIQSSINPTTISGQMINWTIPNVQPLQGGTILVEAQIINHNYTIGDTLYSICYINPTNNDIYPQDNQSIDSSIIMGPYDPNMKLVNKSELTPIEIQGTPWLHYTIYFQNIGGDTAFNVVIKDPLSPYLNPATLQIVASSAPVQSFIDQNRNTSFSFQNIQLPDSSTNYAGSIGYIRYRIQTNPGLQSGMTIENFADIYFDYNAPIRTDTAYTYLSWPVQLQNLNANANFKIYPNPCETGTLFWESDIASNEINWKLYDSIGKLVKISTSKRGNDSSIFEIDLQNIPNGFYLIKMETLDQNYSQSIIIK
jgi:uncharacterized repeat protein (TIGR01451 family)